MKLADFIQKQGVEVVSPLSPQTLVNPFSYVPDMLPEPDHGKSFAGSEHDAQIKQLEHLQILEEVCVTPSGAAYQAGAPEFPEGSWIKRLRLNAERHLFVFAKAILGRRYLSPVLHAEICAFLQKSPPFRKGLLLPRRHAKTSVVSHALPLHILIQPKEDNKYFPSLDGAENRILLACETLDRAVKHVRVVKTALETNKLIRSLWPHRTWQNPRKEAKKWTEQELIIPREQEFPEPSLMAIGVDGAVTGARPTVMIKDDLISMEARNSATVMKRAIDWHVASRALLESYEEDTGLEALEYIIGTRWAIFDLYSYIIDNDPTVEWITRSVIENSQCIYQEYFNLDRVEQLRKELGNALFALLYMNNAADPELVDFDMELVRYFIIENATGNILFPEDYRDSFLKKDHETKSPYELALPPGQTLTSSQVFDRIAEMRAEYLRLRVQ